MQVRLLAGKRIEMSRPLAGIRVISLAEQYPGPYATLLLADLGAEVILVERPGVGDPARGFNAKGRNRHDLMDPPRTHALAAKA